MDMRNLMEKWKKFAGEMNSKGIPIPTLRDPGTKEGGVSFTLLVISSILVIVSIVGKWAGFLGVDNNNAMGFFYACQALYFGRRYVSRGGAQIGDQSRAGEPPQEPGRASPARDRGADNGPTS